MVTQVVAKKARGMLEGWVKALFIGISQVQHVPSFVLETFGQQRPLHGWLKANVDATVFHNGGAISGVFKYERGLFHGACIKHIPFVTESLLLAKIGVQEMLSWFLDRHKQSFIVETNCLQLVALDCFLEIIVSSR